MEMDSPLVRMCIEAATESAAAVEAWRRQRRTLERMPSHLAEALLHCLLRRRLLFPSLLEIFKSSVEEIDLRGEAHVDAEWMAYLGAFRYLRSLNLADCHRINSSAIWNITGMKRLKEVDLSRCSKITDAGIRHLLSIPALEKLCISETGVSSDGTMLLASLTNLLVLDLGGLPVTDSALSSLQVLKKLKHLDLWGSEVSDDGANLLKRFRHLSFLNLAWTKVTKLPNLSPLTSVNMSNCSIHSLLEEGEKVNLEKVVLSGATITDAFETFQYVGKSSLTFLDLSNSALNSFSFLPYFKEITDLNLSGTSLLDDSVENIAGIGANLRYLNLSKTKISSVGIGTLAGHVPHLETILLSGTLVDDTAISYIGMMPSLKVIDLQGTSLKGLVQHVGADPDWVPSFSALESLSSLERLELEGTQIRDEALCPLVKLGRLKYLSLQSSFLTDASLHQISSVPKLINLVIRDSVLTNAGLDSFTPPPTLRVVDLRGCWLLTEDILLSFCQKHPQIEVRHELFTTGTPERKNSSYLSPLRVSARTSPLKHIPAKFSVSPVRGNQNAFLDQRLKYSREELLELQVSSTSISHASDKGGNASHKNRTIRFWSSGRRFSVAYFSD